MPLVQQYLKQLHGDIIAPTFQIIFQTSLNSVASYLATNWNAVLVTPVFKKDCRTTLPSNYRPVFLTCITSKAFEHIIAYNIMKHLKDNNILILPPCIADCFIS